jgi:carbonic anhydrase
MSTKIEESRQKLLAGIRKFRTNVFPERKGAYERVMREGQKPHALFLTCADSRIDPELLTQSGPGDIFASRNIGNIVPPYGESAGGMAAVIEYAGTLEISQIVVCGHSGCGAMQALLHPEKAATLPLVKSWLRNGEAALSVVQARRTVRDEWATLDELTEENVLLQMSHLRTYPAIAGRLAQETMALSGWVYDIAHGAVRIYDESQRKFMPAEGR